jgi:hypothetical protein
MRSAIRIELPAHGTFHAHSIVAFTDALKLGKRKLARDIAECYVGGSGLSRVATPTYWLGYPVAILAVVWLDALHSHDTPTEFRECPHCEPERAHADSQETR